MIKILAMNHSFMKIDAYHIKMLSECIPGAQVETFEAAPTPEQLRDADYIFGNMPAASLLHCEKLKMIQLATAGLNDFTHDSMPKGAKIATATGCYGLTIGEHMLAVLLCMMRRLPSYILNQQRELWQFEGKIRSVWGSIVLLLGLGDIGGEFARRVKALGATTIGVRRAGTEKPDFVDELCHTDKLDELLPRADVVAMSLPSTPATAGILDKERIDRMKPGAYLINVGRGNAIDEEAVCDALDEGRLAGAALDVFSTEPLPAEHRLWQTPGLLITPHVAGGSNLPETVNRIVALAARNFSAIEAGERIQSEVDFTTGYRKL